MKILVAGAGLSGAVIGRTLADAGHQVTILDERAHIAGNCHTERDADTGVMCHLYGPHIFHTDNEDVWQFVTRFARMRPYRHQVKTIYDGAVYSLPINLHTINQFFGRTFRPEEARAHVARLTSDAKTPAQNFEEQALQLIGADLYEAFFKGYTVKQWGRDPQTLPASILKRLPLRFNYDDRYFSHRYQAIPEAGYTDMVAAMLDHANISLSLSTRLTRADRQQGFDHVFFSGPLDSWFDHDFGRLGYRTLDFERLTYDGDYQGCAVMNFADPDVAATRITEHKHFAPWEEHDKSVLYREVSREAQEGDTPYYPIRLVKDKSLLGTYVKHAEKEKNLTFVGRLGTYRYIDMDVAIAEALETARLFLKTNGAMPVFVHPPL